MTKLKIGDREYILAAYQDGATSQTIADKVGVTRARVHQILQEAGLGAKDGGKHVAAIHKAAIKEKETLARKDELAIAHYGVPAAQVRALNNKAPRRQSRCLAFRYKMKRQNCLREGQKFNLTFPEFCAVWKAAGVVKASQVGRRGLTRIDHTKPYEVGNVVIKSMKEIGVETRKRDKSRK